MKKRGFYQTKTFAYLKFMIQKQILQLKDKWYYIQVTQKSVKFVQLLQEFLDLLGWDVWWCERLK
jgi:hypothetical protein